MQSPFEVPSKAVVCVTIAKSSKFRDMWHQVLKHNIIFTHWSSFVYTKPFIGELVLLEEFSCRKPLDLNEAWICTGPRYKLDICKYLILARHKHV